MTSEAELPGGGGGGADTQETFFFVSMNIGVNWDTR